MAMQHSSKGATGSAPDGPDPSLSDEQADQFAASFTPAWDTDDATTGDGPDNPDATINTTVMDRSQLPIESLETAPTETASVEDVKTAVIVATPAKYNAKRTMIGLPPPAVMKEIPRPPSSAESVEPHNMLEVVTAPAPPAQPPHAPQKNFGSNTMLMSNRPQQSVSPQSSQGPQASQAPTPPAYAMMASAAPAARSARPSGRPVPSQGPRAVAADPFRSGANRRPSSSDELDALVPKRSGKTIALIVMGIAVVAGLGLFLRFALSDDAPSRSTAEPMVTGPAVTTAEIPPPPPPRVVEPAPTATAAAATATAMKTAEPAPEPLPVPTAQPTPPAPVAQAAPPVQMQQPVQRNRPAPAAAQAPAPSPKTAPKSPNGGIVRDNPF